MQKFCSKSHCLRCEGAKEVACIGIEPSWQWCWTAPAAQRDFRMTFVETTDICRGHCCFFATWKHKLKANIKWKRSTVHCTRTRNEREREREREKAESNTEYSSANTSIDAHKHAANNDERSSTILAAHTHTHRHTRTNAHVKSCKGDWNLGCHAGFEDNFFCDTHEASANCNTPMSPVLIWLDDLDVLVTSAIISPYPVVPWRFVIQVRSTSWRSGVQMGPGKRSATEPLPAHSTWIYYSPWVRVRWCKMPFWWRPNHRNRKCLTITKLDMISR